jgi:hypothetical protein
MNSTIHASLNSLINPCLKWQMPMETLCLKQDPAVGKFQEPFSI